MAVCDAGSPLMVAMASWFSKVPMLSSPNSSSRGGVFVLLTTALAAICGIFAVVMLDARADARRAAEASGINLATALAQDLARNVESLDLSIEAARDAWLDARVRALAPDLRQMPVFDHSATARHIDAILVADADGTVVADSRNLVPRPTNVRDADYFRAQVERDGGLFVSRPIRGADGSGWRMAFSRRMTDTAGRFAGVGVGFLNLDYLAEVYGRLPLGEGGSLSLFNTDGTLLVRQPMGAGAVGRSLRGRSMFDSLSASDHGAFEGTSQIHGTQRLFAFHRVGSLPLIQVVATSTQAVYAEWRAKALMLGGVMVLLCTGTLALLFLLKRELAQRVAAETALHRWATRDDLTGLLNRRLFFELANERIAAAIRGASGVSLLMIDADHFKSYNDRYGHPAGDAVLAAIARCIEAEMRRATDLAARFGGEEFIALLPATGRAQAFVIAEAIRTAVARLSIPHDRATAGIVTVSVGFATAEPKTPVALSRLVEVADAELYKSKRSGRNRSTGADGPAGMRPSPPGAKAVTA